MKNEIFIQITRIQTRVQTNSDGKGGWKVPSGKGQRLIVVHAGGEEK